MTKQYPEGGGLRVEVLSSPKIDKTSNEIEVEVSRLKKTFPVLSFVKSETSGVYVRDNVHEWRRRHHVFVGLCYTFMHPHRHIVILE